MSHEYPTIIVTAEMLRATRRCDRAWLRRKQEQTQAQLDRLQALLNKNLWKLP